jgi:hypothetical protein
VGRGAMHIGFWWGNQKKRDNYGRIILKRILEEQVLVVWAELIWLRIGTNGGLL